MNDANGHIHPLNLCIGEARAAERLGDEESTSSPGSSSWSTAKNPTCVRNVAV